MVSFRAFSNEVNSSLALRVYCMIPDGRYIFSTDGGNMVMQGLINWDIFETPDAIEISELVGVNCTIKPLLESKGVVFRSANSLYYYELP